MSAMDLTRSSRPALVFAQLLVGFSLLTICVLVFTPWQQAVPASGRVIAYAPDERRQNLDSPIEGRVVKWHVREGSIVLKGDPIVDLSDNDPEMVLRLREERDAVAARLDAAKARARSMEFRIDSLESSRVDGISAAESRVRMASERAGAAEQAVALAEATYTTARLNVERQRGLAAQGLTSTRQLELIELEETRARTDLERAKVTLAAAKSERTALESDRKKVGNDASASINEGRASQSSAEMEVANASAELARIEVRLARQSAQAVLAPRSGTIFRIVANGHSGEIVKAGDLLAVLVPDTADRAVEVWIAGNDMPLVHRADRARVQFEGWPAVQFSGWPSVAIGTFPGRVSFVDSTDNGAGLFRVVITPEPNTTWPSPHYLRQGVRVEGWVQLGQVRLGYELWRQFNGFPPSLAQAPSMDSSKSSTEKEKKL